MRKVIKLIRRPGAFFRDGVDNFLARNRRVGKLARLLRGERISARSSSLSDASILSLVGTAKVHRHAEILRCRREDVVWVFGHAAKLARARELRVSMGDFRRALSADDFTLRFLDGTATQESLRFIVSDESPPASYFVDVGRLHECPDDASHAFDVDVVYTWVNHDDPWWRDAIRQHKPDHQIEWDRYTNVDELRYSLRSIHAFAPWARKVYIVTNCSAPSWLVEHPQVVLVPHTDIFPVGAALPTFSSHAIEACLLNIEGLSEHFVYFNDDVFLGRATSKATFFSRDGKSVSFLEPHEMVLGDNAPNLPDYMNAAINGRNLMKVKYGTWPTRLHQHGPHALKRSVFRAMVEAFPKEFETVRSARFRTQRDISSVSFLYHHFADATGESVQADESGMLIGAAHAERGFHRLINESRRLFFCINDGGDSAHDQRFQAAKERFLEDCYPMPAPWEPA